MEHQLTRDKWTWTEIHENWLGEATHPQGFRAAARVYKDRDDTVRVIVTVMWADPVIPPSSEDYREVVCGVYEGTAESWTFATLDVYEHAQRIIDLQPVSYKDVREKSGKGGE